MCNAGVSWRGVDMFVVVKGAASLKNMKKSSTDKTGCETVAVCF